MPELAAAELAGVGCRGRHGLRIVPPYGSYVFLGTILTDLVLPSTRSVRGDPLPAPLPGLSSGLPHRRPDGAGV